MRKGPIKALGILQKGNLAERYGSLCKKLEKYRIERELFEARKTVLPFVTGLRFSALLIYEMRTILKNTHLAVNWGTIIDDGGHKCAAECDILVHKNGSEFAWNGEIDVGGSVMDFHFVNKQNVKLVVSCKAFKVSQIDQNMKDDVVKLGDYIENVWLFVEYCKAKQLRQLHKDAKNAGYKKFYPLYLEKEDGFLDYDENIWCEFAQSLRQLAAK
ncbi:MAG: hypothetical protein ABIF19_12050 [Planctomycetota bacterium]